jgi:putative ABC transport system substrate-binding protein
VFRLGVMYFTDGRMAAYYVAFAVSQPIGIKMRRRDFITLLGGATVSGPLAASAQQPAMPVIGFLGSGSSELWEERLRDFRQGLRETGYIEAQNVAIEFRWADSQYNRLPALAADLVRRRVTVITTAANVRAASAAKEATSTIPIVFQVGVDPVEVGLVASLSRPGGNLTGVATLSRELAPKRLEVLHELVPTATVIAQLENPTNPIGETARGELEAAAHTLGLQLHILRASTERDFEPVFATLRDLRVGALVIGNETLFSTWGEALAALALRHGMPTVGQYRTFAAVGGLMTYGGSLTDAYRLLGVNTGRILKGEKPSDLPVQQSTKVELIINLKTAKALGLAVPLPLLGRADEVIE